MQANRLPTAICCVALGAVTSAPGQSPSDRAAHGPAPRTSARADLLTGPAGPMQSVAGAKPTLEFRLLPVATYPPDGVYNTGGLYDDSDITGEHNNILTLHSGPGRVFLNLFLANWDPDYAGDPFAPGVTRLRAWGCWINSFSFPNGVGVPIHAAREPCTNSAQCAAMFGEAGSYCFGQCNSVWVHKSPPRPDGIQNELTDPSLCTTNYWDFSFGSNFGFTWYGGTNEAPCGRPDDKPQHYSGSFALDIPVGARGTYTINMTLPEAIDDTPLSAGGFQEIPIAALIDPIIHVVGDDCNSNLQHDMDDISLGVSEDINGSGVPDECEDCQPNGVIDGYDIADGTSQDCNDNALPDECDIADCGLDAACGDCDDNGVPDGCDLAGSPIVDLYFADCNENGVPDGCDIELCVSDPACDDCNENNIPDACDLAACVDDKACGDCNANGRPDLCDIRDGLLLDGDNDGRPDLCHPIPTVSEWGLCILTLGLLILAKARSTGGAAKSSMVEPA